MACGPYDPPMDPNGLDALVAERAIRDVVMRYCRGIDRRQFELVRDCYHADVCVFDWTRTDPVTGWQFTDAFRRGRTDVDDVVFSPSLHDVIDAGGAIR